MNLGIDLLMAPLGYEFMQRGMLASVIVGVLCAVVGCYVVLRGMAFLGDAVAHAVLPGVAVAYLLKVDMLIGALIAAIFVALGIGYLSRRGQMKEDTAIGVIFSAALALGVALMSTIRTYTTDLAHVLFGNVLGVGVNDLLLTGGLAVVVLSIVMILYREFLVVSFDPVLAATLRLPINLLRNLILILLSLTVVVSLQTVGVGLVTAMLVTPGATAYLIVKRLPSMMLLSAFIGAGSSLAGLYLSFYLNIASGAAIVLVCTTCFLAAYLFAPERGAVWTTWRRTRIGQGRIDATGTGGVEGKQSKRLTWR